MNQSPNLKSQTFRAGLWNFGGAGADTVLRFGVSVVLARLLAPEEFGLLAMILVFQEVARMFIEGGFGIALIHRKNATRVEESSILFLNVGVALLAYTVLWFCSPLVADFYKQPILTDLLRLTSLGLIVSALGIVQGSVLGRKLDFKSLNKARVVSSTCSGTLAIVLASAGWGVWALAWQSLGMAFVNTLVLWLMSSWRPVWSFSLAGVRTMGAYGVKMLASNIVTTLFDNLNSILIGRFYTAADLGYFSRAKSTQALATGLFCNPVAQVMIPAMVHLNDKPEEFRRAYRRTLQMVIAISAPLMVGGFLLADPFIRFVFGDKWEISIPFFQVFCIAGILYPVHLININMLLSLGRPGLYLKIEIAKRLISLAIALVTIQHSVMALALGGLLSTLLCYPINAYYPGKLAGLHIWGQLRDMAPYVFNVLPAGLLTFWILPMLPEANIARLLIGGSIFLILLLPGPLIFRDNIYFYLLKNNPLKRTK